ncbi:DALR anticodon-binding domain-containing protein 3 isoform X2 [Colletes gigas]|nr:DALR anticodon-binding domain-containing protein 3 isoform X2 [Colletes gigas]
MHSSNIDVKIDTDVAKQVLQSLISSSHNWQIKIERYFLEKERVCLFLHRAPLVANSIKTVIDLGHSFGRISSIDKVFKFKVQRDKESELTTTRLCLIQSVTENLLNLHGCRVGEEDSSYKLVFTTKSKGNADETYKKYVCGVVKNLESNAKETKLKWEDYIQNKSNELKAMNDQKNFETHDCNVQIDNHFFENVAKATATFELLSIKPSRSVVIGHNSAPDKGTTNMKGASFILYNSVRINAIIEKYNGKRLTGEYPDLPNIHDVDFTLLHQEEEWELIYNFIIGYQEMIKDCLKYEPVFQTNPQAICMFLSRLCQKFSIYYRKIRILTDAYDHLIPTMIARLYMLHALQIVLQNALALLNIVPVSRM